MTGGEEGVGQVGRKGKGQGKLTWKGHHEYSVVEPELCGKDKSYWQRSAGVAWEVQSDM